MDISLIYVIGCLSFFKQSITFWSHLELQFPTQVELAWSLFISILGLFLFVYNVVTVITTNLKAASYVFVLKSQCDFSCPLIIYLFIFTGISHTHFHTKWKCFYIHFVMCQLQETWTGRVNKGKQGWRRRENMFEASEESSRSQAS